MKEEGVDIILCDTYILYKVPDEADPQIISRAADQMVEWPNGRMGVVWCVGGEHRILHHHRKRRFSHSHESSRISRGT